MLCRVSLALTSRQANSIPVHASGQHKDVTKVMKEQDHSDTTKIVDCLPQRIPFGTDPSLCNIATGVEAEDGVNCDKAKEAGDKIVDGWKECSWVFISKEAASANPCKSAPI